MPSPFGTTAVSLVVDTVVTFGEVSDPKATTMPGANPLPLTVTVLPVIPFDGVNEVTLGG